MRKYFVLTCILAAIASSLYSQTPVVNAKPRTVTININGNPNESNWEFTKQCNQEYHWHIE